MPIDNSPRSTGRLGRGRRLAHQGFTLIELIMVIVILGVLAVYAAPRILSTDDFYARGFHDETLSLLRYAQKTAIAQRRTVCVVFTSTSASLSIAQNAPTASTPTPTCSPSSALTGPRGENPAAIPAAAHGVTYNGGPPTAFNLDGLGQPMTTAGVLLTAQTVIQITNATNVYVEAVTGYVHD